MKPFNGPAVTLKRRSFLRIALGALAGCAGWFASCAPGKEESVEHALAARLLHLLGMQDMALQGALRKTACSTDVVNEDAIGCLCAMLGTDTAQFGRCMQLSDDELRQRLRAQIAADYRNGAMHQLQGWWLSETEYQAFALNAHLSGRALVADKRDARRLV